MATIYRRNIAILSRSRLILVSCQDPFAVRGESLESASESEVAWEVWREGGAMDEVEQHSLPQQLAFHAARHSRKYSHRP